MAKGATRDSLRRHNLSAVLGRVHLDGPMSRSALTQVTGLNRSTIGALVGELEEHGLVEHGDPDPTGAAGRPSPMVVPSASTRVVMAVDIATKVLTAGVGALGGALLAQEERVVDNDERDYAETVAEVADMLRGLMRGLDGPEVYAVGVAAPGVVRTGDGFVHVAPNVGWKERPLGRDLTAALGGIPVVVANEAHLGARAEHLRGAGTGVDDMVYLSGEIGIGGGAIVGGALHVGADGYSGEVGHIPVNTSAEAVSCRCGSTGCLEAEAGALALLRLMDVPATEHIMPEVSEILARADDGDARARAALEEIGRRLGRGVAGLINVLNPRRVVLGGYFAEGFSHIRSTLTQELDDHALTAHLSGVTIVPADLRGSSAMIGAMEVAWEPLLADPGSSSRPVTATA